MMNPSPIRLLLIEDSPPDAFLLKTSLEETGEKSFQVTLVELMSEAIETLGREKFDVILLDLSLPDCRGIQTVDRANAAAPEVPIVVMTGLDDEAAAVEAVRKGAQDFLIKGQSDHRLLVRSIRYAIERKQAELQLKTLNETLEQRVAERTTVATARAAQLRVLASELTRSEQRERGRLAQMLHDELQQTLYAARLSLGSLRRAELDDSLREMVDRVDELIGQSIAQSRSLTHQLSPTVLFEAGLAAALAWLGGDMKEKCGLDVEVEADPKADPKNHDVRILFFQAARELLFNVAKHAHANRAKVVADVLPGVGIRLMVSDEGAGFRLEESKNEKSASPGFGLFSVRERLELLGGRMQINSAPGRGTKVTLFAPAEETTK
jgi:signal transduction histidine kinase